jgi:hypothetical protein
MGSKIRVDSEKRTETWSVRFNADEATQANALRKLTGLKKADYLRAAALRVKLPTAVPEANIQLHEDLRRIGINLTQIARGLNEGLTIDFPYLAKQLGEFQRLLVGASDALALEREKLERES